MCLIRSHTQKIERQAERRLSVTVDESVSDTETGSTSKGVKERGGGERKRLRDKERE